METQPETRIDWQAWLERWEARMDHFVADREGLFATMLDVLGALVSDDLIALDLGCGPGSLSQRLLSRFPRARCLAVDLDPVLLAIGQGALGAWDGRLRWVKADLIDDDWSARIREAAAAWYPAEPEAPLDAALSSSVLHHIPSDRLVGVYHRLGELLRPGGALLNGDFLPFGPHLPTFGRVTETVKAARQAATPEAEGQPSAAEWWDALRAEPALAALFELRDRAIPPGQAPPRKPIHDLHVAALRDAGFREVGVIWQNLDKRLLLAVK